MNPRTPGTPSRRIFGEEAADELADVLIGEHEDRGDNPLTDEDRETLAAIRSGVERAEEAAAVGALREALRSRGFVADDEQAEQAWAHIRAAAEELGQPCDSITAWQLGLGRAVADGLQEVAPPASIGDAINETLDDMRLARGEEPAHGERAAKRHESDAPKTLDEAFDAFEAMRAG